MPSLTLIETEAERLLRRIPASRRRAQQAALAELCESHWRQIRGAEPQGALAQALWSETPPLSDLFVDLYGAGETGLYDALAGLDLSEGLALLVLLEIERGSEAAVHLAHEPMMAFESLPPSAAWRARLAALLRGMLEPPLMHPHDHHPVLWRALAVIAAQTGRLDLPAVIQVIALLAPPGGESGAPHDEQLERLRRELLELGIRFLGIEDGHIELQQHGREHKPVRTRQVGEMLQEIRGKWLR